MRVVYITAPTKKEAKDIAQFLVTKKLAACVNLFPIESIYEWKGKLVEGIEYALLAKTSDENYHAIEQAVKKMHSYDVPAICSWKVDKADPMYDSWVQEQS